MIRVARAVFLLDSIGLDNALGDPLEVLLGLF